MPALGLRFGGCLGRSLRRGRAQRCTRASGWDTGWTRSDGAAAGLARDAKGKTPRPTPVVVPLTVVALNPSVTTGPLPELPRKPPVTFEM